jgi:hypothetical protein
MMLPHPFSSRNLAPETLQTFRQIPSSSRRPAFDAFFVFEASSLASRER